MDNMLYVAMSGAKETLIAQTSNNHNLANVNTAGFRQDLAQFRSMPVFGPGQPSRVYALTERPGVDFAPGSMQTTGRDLDLAVKEAGFIAVQAPDGTEAYTRAGDLRVSSLGLLLTGAGHPVLGNGGPVAIPPAEKLEVGNDGTISIRPLGQDAKTLAELDRIKLVKPPHDALEKGLDGLFHLKEGGVAPPDAAVSLVSGALESSNVDAVEALVGMITLARQFEMQVRMMNVAEENDASTAQMLRLT